MVKLDNPYPVPKPPLIIFIPVILLYLAGYLCFRYSLFAFPYQYALTVLTLILVSFLFDRDLLTSERIFNFKYSFHKKKIIVLGSAGVLILLLWVSSGFLFKRPVLYDFYCGTTPLSAVELGLLLVFVVGPFEEIFFRAYLQKHMGDLLGKAGGYAAASLLYGLFFLLYGGTAVALYFFVTGLFFGFLYMMSSSVPINIVLRSALMIFLLALRF